jgi:hypothetical protein
MPQNYLIANKSRNGWICNPDPAADKDLCKRVFEILLTHHGAKWGSGENLLKEIECKQIFAFNSVGKRVKVFGDVTSPQNTVRIEFEDGHQEQRFVEQLELIERCCNCRELDKDINCKKCLFYQ